MDDVHHFQNALQAIKVAEDAASGLSLACIVECIDESGRDEKDTIPLTSGSSLVLGPEVGTWLCTAAEILNDHWPRASGTYQNQLIQKARLARVLPCSYVALQENQCVGHIKLSETFDSGSLSGSACAATFVVVSQKLRGKGIGRLIMSLAEQEATSLGYHYMYLWTKDAVPFYVRCGYKECDRISMYRPCLKSIGAAQVLNLESMLAKRLSRLNDDSGGCEGVVAATTGPMQEVWLRKRLVELLGSEDVSQAERFAELTSAVEGRLRQTLDGQACSRTWAYKMIGIPWQRQIGPSCGLACVRMVRDFFLSRRSLGQARHPSLLATALERGITSDGEIYDMEDLLALASDICGLKGSVLEVSDMSDSDLIAMLAQEKLVVLPYDSDIGTRLPCLNEGTSAHIGVVVGASWPIGCLGNVDHGFDNEPCMQEADAPMIGRASIQKHVDGLLLTVQHSSAKGLAISSADSFRASNAQLLKSRFKLEGKQLSLSGKALVFRGIADIEAADG